MSKLGLVRASSLMPFVRFLVENGIELAPHFEKALLPEQLIEDDEAWIPKRQVYLFLSDVAAQHHLESIGLIVGDQICVADWGPLGQAIHDGETLADAIRIFSDLLPRFAEGNEIVLTDGGAESYFCYRTLDHTKGNRDYADHYGMMMLLSIVRLAVGERWYPDRVTIQTGVSDAFIAHPVWANSRIAFEAEGTGFYFPSEWLSRSIPAMPEPEGAGGSIPMGPSVKLSESLRSILQAYVRIGGVPSLEKVAETLSMNERTLKRRLKHDGRTYSEIAEGVRLHAAKSMLEEGVTPVREIALILGYSGANNFIRAFQKKMQVTPGEYRDTVRRV